MCVFTDAAEIIMPVISNCVICGKETKVRPSHAKLGKGKTCSVKCRSTLGGLSKDNSKENNPGWRGGQSRSKEKKSAWNAVHKALKSGKISKPCSCENCGKTEELHAHHKDYAKKLDVNWLCRLCHAEIHKTSPHH